MLPGGAGEVTNGFPSTLGAFLCGTQLGHARHEKAAFAAVARIRGGAKSLVRASVYVRDRVPKSIGDRPSKLTMRVRFPSPAPQLGQLRGHSRRKSSHGGACRAVSCHNESRSGPVGRRRYDPNGSGRRWPGRPADELIKGVGDGHVALAGGVVVDQRRPRRGMPHPAQPITYPPGPKSRWPGGHRGAMKMLVVAAGAWSPNHFGAVSPS